MTGDIQNHDWCKSAVKITDYIYFLCSYDFVHRRMMMNIGYTSSYLYFECMSQFFSCINSWHKISLSYFKILTICIFSQIINGIFLGMNGSHSPQSTLNGRTPSPPTLGSLMNSSSGQQLPPACGARQLSKLKRFLTTLQQFGSDISPDIGERVRTLVLGLVVSICMVTVGLAVHFLYSMQMWKKRIGITSLN